MVARISLERQNDEVALRVRDIGIGMTEQMLTQAFDLFTQAEHAPNHVHGGLGISLTLVRSLVQLHGGSVQAFSDGLGKGSEFVVLLPYHQAAETHGKDLGGIDDRSDRPERETGPSRGRRVLIVDDNVDNAETLAAFLRIVGYEVLTAYNGLAGLDAARTFRPEVVLLDIGMPGINGYDMARRLRQEPGLENVLLVALTGYGQEEDRRRSREATIDHHLVKPADPEALRALLGHPRSPPA